MRPRLRDVADHAGVSEATVSRVLNGRPGVSAGTRAAVLDALAALGHPGEAEVLPVPARAVGVVVPELDNPVFPLFAQAIERRLQRHGLFALIVTATLEGTPEAGVIATLRERGVDGFVFVSGLHADRDADHSAYRRLADNGIPFVLVNGTLPDLDCPSVSADDRAAGHLAVRQLWDLGHRRIGFAGGLEQLQPTRRKLAGVREALARVDGEPPTVAEVPFTVEGGQLAAPRFLEQGCTGIVAASDLIALGVIRAVRAAGLGVPKDVSIIGFDDTLLVSHTDPPLTTIRQPVADMAAAAADALALRLAGSPTVVGEYLFRPDLVVRASTGPAPAAVPSSLAATHAAY